MNRILGTVAVVMLVVVAISSATKRKPCNWRCNAPECMCVRRENAALAECICAGERGLGEECLDELQCSNGNKCRNKICVEVPEEPPTLPRWAYEDIFDKDED